MKLTKEAQQVWDKLKAEGKTEEEILEAIPVWPYEYESEEERQQDVRALNEARQRERAKRTPEQQKELDEFVNKVMDGTDKKGD